MLDHFTNLVQMYCTYLQIDVKSIFKGGFEPYLSNLAKEKFFQKNWPPLASFLFIFVVNTN